MADGKPQVSIAFYADEVNLFRVGREAYLEMLAETATSQLDDTGAVGPYEFFVSHGDGAVNPFVFVGREL